ncbi:MAG: hypothetical protein V4591_01940 [Bdellovibrionota bacterium]
MNLKNVFLMLVGLLAFNYAYADTSESLREQHPFYVAGQTSLVSDMSSALGGKIGWRSKDWAVEGQYNWGTIDYDERAFVFFSSYVSGKTKIKNESYALDVKYFVSNSFYVASGLSYQHRTSSHESPHLGTHDDCSLFDSNCETFYERWENDGNETVDFVTSHVFIGNQWEFWHLSIGADWVGVSVPLFTIDRTTSGPHSLDRGIKTIEPYFLRVYIGISI